MPFSLGSQAPRQDRTEFPFYADHLLPALQSALAALADLDTRYERERDHLEQWTGPEAVKARLIVALEAEWTRSREPIVARLDRLQGAVLNEAQLRQATDPDQDASSKWFNSAA